MGSAQRVTQPPGPSRGFFLSSSSTVPPFGPSSGRHCVPSPQSHMHFLGISLLCPSALCFAVTTPTEPIYLLKDLPTCRAERLSREPRPLAWAGVYIWVCLGLSSLSLSSQVPHLCGFSLHPARLSSAFCQEYTLWSGAWKLLLPNFPPTGRRRPCAWSAWSCGKGLLVWEAAAA